MGRWRPAPCGCSAFHVAVRADLAHRDGQFEKGLRGADCTAHLVALDGLAPEVIGSASIVAASAQNSGS